VGELGLHGLVNNAGVAIGGPLEHLAIEDLRRQLDVNVVAHVAVTQAVLPLIRRATGRLVFIGSLSGRVGLPMIGAYAAAKFALEGLTESWRAELSPWGIKVILIEPGSIKTEIWGKARDDAREVERRFPPHVLEQYRAHIDMARTVVERQDKAAISPSKVARTVEAALFDSRPRTRYLVGMDARSVAAMSRFLPDGLKASLIGLASGTRLPRRKLEN
jgi:NAD(P)-dependent dehydrogenase (short-subunit alcohol dehydrogenase family)